MKTRSMTFITKRNITQIKFFFQQFQDLIHFLRTTNKRNKELEEYHGLHQDPNS